VHDPGVGHASVRLQDRAHVGRLASSRRDLGKDRLVVGRGLAVDIDPRRARHHDAEYLLHLIAGLRRWDSEALTGAALGRALERNDLQALDPASNAQPLVQV
jgi:hypothetical protein